MILAVKKDLKLPLVLSYLVIYILLYSSLISDVWYIIRTIKSILAHETLVNISDTIKGSGVYLTTKNSGPH